MIDHVELRRGEYHDSVVLMRLSTRIGRREDVAACLVAMATPLNLSLLGDLGFDAGAADGARPADLLVAIRADGREALDAALGETAALLASPAANGGSGAAERHPSLASAVRESGAGLAVISVPGPHVVPEAMDALAAGASVMIFSDGVSLADEVGLKAEAARRGLLVMGPDCGTARLGGVALGFCNALSNGDVGIVSASGTGAQHVACLLDARGIGVGAIIGVGGRDTSDAVGGASTLRALELLAADPATRIVAVVSKPPGPATVRRLADAAASLGKPVVLGLLGAGVDTLEEIAANIAAAAGRPFDAPRSALPDMPLSPGRIVGLYSGGTLAEEARRVLGSAGVESATLDAFAAPTPTAIAAFRSDVVVDLGDDRLTAGRPHPMIDPTLRVEAIEALARRGEPASLLLDVVLGFGAHDEPVAAMADALSAFLAVDGTSAAVSLVGTDGDPQDAGEQLRLLADLGCAVFESNARAAAAVAAARSGHGGTA